MTLQPGQHLWWHYRSSTWQPGDPQWISPMTVVKDDPQTLVAWLAPETYINLEAPIRRDGRHVYTEDHVLDVWVTPDRVCHRKDEDELEAAVTHGRCTPEEASSITSTPAWQRRRSHHGSPRSPMAGRTGAPIRAG